jgi:hypothetical protein
MSFRIYEYSYGVLGLVLRKRRSKCNRLSHSHAKIINGNVEMEHHLLIATLAWPGGGPKVIISLKTDE